MEKSTEDQQTAYITEATENLPWFHSIELFPGYYTPGNNNCTSIVPVRELLKRCEVQSMRCLDVGTMEGLISTLLCRRSAAQVFACDRYDRSEQINLVRSTLRTDFQYVPSVTLAQLRGIAHRVQGGAFDLVVFSGVLYHMYDPMQGLALIRTMVREGGMVLIESIAAVSDKHVGYFNARGNIAADPHHYWTLSVALLDYLLRLFRLKPLDCAFLPFNGTTEDGSALTRIAIPCRAIGTQLADDDDSWMVVPAPHRRNDEVEYRDWSTNPGQDLAYDGVFCDRPVWRASGALDLLRTVSGSSPVETRGDLTKLALDAIV